MKIIKHRKIFYAISIILLGVSLFGMVKYGLKLGVDFNGGTLIEVNFTENTPSSVEVAEKLEAIGVEGAVVRPTE